MPLSVANRALPGAATDENRDHAPPPRCRRSTADRKSIVPPTDDGSSDYADDRHFCLDVVSVDTTVAELRARRVTMVAEPFVADKTSRLPALVVDPIGNLIEFAEAMGPWLSFKRNPLNSTERG